jgi:hypothetical protein
MVRIPDTVKIPDEAVDKLLPVSIVTFPPTMVVPSTVNRELSDKDKSPAMPQYFKVLFAAELAYLTLLIVIVFVNPEAFSLPSMVT